MSSHKYVDSLASLKVTFTETLILPFSTNQTLMFPVWFPSRQNLWSSSLGPRNAVEGRPSQNSEGPGSASHLFAIHQLSGQGQNLQHVVGYRFPAELLDTWGYHQKLSRFHTYATNNVFEGLLPNTQDTSGEDLVRGKEAGKMTHVHPLWLS